MNDQNQPCPSCGHQVPVPVDCCISCGGELRRVFDGDFTSRQYAGALEVILEGGYGQYFDNIDGNHHVFLCAGCADTLCEQHAWLKELFDGRR